MMEYSHKHTFVFFLVIVLVFSVGNGLLGRTCQVSGIIKCCDFFYNHDGVCVECPFGFQTNEGNQCVPCTDGFFGKRCIFECNCNGTKSCDHVSGMCNEGTSPRSTEDVECNGVRDAVFYGGLCTALIVGGLISIFLHRLRQRCTGQRFENKDVTEPRSTDDISHVPSGYNYIDESQMEEISFKTSQPNQSALAKDSREDTPKQKLLKVNSCPNPYLPMESVASGYHQYSDIRSSQNEDSLDQSEYLNPYTSLVKVSRKEDNHKYNECTLQHIKNSQVLKTDEGPTCVLDKMI